MLVSSAYSWQTGAENCSVIIQKETLATIISRTLIRGAQNGHPCGARIIVIVLVCKTLSFVAEKCWKKLSQGQDVNDLVK